ncbi:MAG: hypothetical protein CYG60_10415 [Actinobacteria bacterium]|nr:MAG: hypothetical protein CYG60_10415 [Actinomycetota bacterium]
MHDQFSAPTPARTSTGQDGQPESKRIPEYHLRGLGILTISAQEILESYRGGGHWLVPSGTDPSKSYEVRVGTRPDRNRCECRGWDSHRHCSHLVAASRVAKASAVCDSCGKRCWQHDLVEVQEDDGLLSWHEGDRLCRSCVRDGAWA